jgi:hypothetical protein
MEAKILMKTGILGTAFLALFLSGCAAPPLKGRADLLDFLGDGKTTREEVVLKLGPPSGKFERKNLLTCEFIRSRTKTATR